MSIATRRAIQRCGSYRKNGNQRPLRAIRRKDKEVEPYHKIQTVFLRDPDTKYRTLLDGQFAKPEFEYLKDNEWIFTEKIDGTNIRVVWDASARLVLFRGKTDRAQIPPFLYLKLETMFTVDLFHAYYPETSMTLYGEGYGAKIQKGGGKYIQDGVDFILFDVNIGGIFLERENVEDIANNLGIKVVPIIGRGTLRDAVIIAQHGFASQVGTQTAEGLVMRPSVELLSRRGERVISKVKHRDFS
jgi:ATP-dependent RNA circularization protein (DNA/RNA ligase family)